MTTEEIIELHRRIVEEEKRGIKSKETQDLIAAHKEIISKNRK